MRAIILAFRCFFAVIAAQAGDLPLAAPQPKTTPAQILKAYGQLPLSFEPNQGQSDAKVEFLARGQGYSLFLTPGEAVLALRKASPGGAGRHAGNGTVLIKTLQHAASQTQASALPLLPIDDSCLRDAFCKSNSTPTATASPVPELNWPATNSAAIQPAGKNLPPGLHRAGAEPSVDPIETLTLHMKLAGADPKALSDGQEPLPGKVSYFKGKDPAKWHKGIPTYDRVTYRNVYPGIDLAYYGNQGQLEYDFIVQLGADPKDIRLSFDGIDNATIDAKGDLLLHVPGGEVRMHKPVVYQDIKGQRRSIDGWFVLHDALGKKQDKQIGFQISQYDTKHPLVIDPTLVYSTYFGGNGDDNGQAIAVDGYGNIYVTGYTLSADFPTANALYPAGGDLEDAFVFKLSGDGQLLKYSTYFGGNNSDQGMGIVADDGGNTYVTGYTDSLDFPIANAIQPSHGGTGRNIDVFVFKLNSDGQSLGYSTYFGGSGPDKGIGIAVDDGGNASVTGFTESSDFPTANALYPNGNTGQQIFVFKLSGDGQSLNFSTYFGGRDSGIGYSVAVDDSGYIYVTGITHTTTSTDFPTVNALYPNPGAGSPDAFVFKLTSDGQTVVFSTYFGGNGADYGQAVAVDGYGSIYVTGYTLSTDFPTVNAMFPSNAGSHDVFVFKLGENGQSLIFSTYFGGTVSDLGYGIAVDGNGNAYVTGSTNSADFLTANSLYPNFAGGANDAFVFKLSGDGQTVSYSTYLGGSFEDISKGIAVDGDGNAYITGRTWSSGFPTANALYPNLNGSNDIFIAKIFELLPLPPGHLKTAEIRARSLLGVVQVAVLTDGDLDAAKIHPYTSFFGPTGSEGRMRSYGYKDIEPDGDQDLVLMFDIGETGFDCGSAWQTVSGILNAYTYDEQVTATRTFDIPPCGVTPRGWGGRT